MTSRRLTPILALAPALLLQGCASIVQPVPQPAETLVVVVPSRFDGHVGAVVVNEADRREVLDTAYAAARTRGSDGPITRSTETPEAIKAMFASASEALPRKAVTYTLYFTLAKSELTPESRAALDAMIGEVALRQAAEVIVSGHTDRTGTEAQNDALSLKRAEMIRDLVIQRGPLAISVSATGLGEREPLVVTEDGVDEPKNRRVEILVR